MANWKAKIELDIKDLQRQLIDADEKIDKFANEDRKVKLDIDTKTLESAIQKLDKMLDSLSKGTGDFKQFENLSKELSSIVSEVQSLSKAFGKVDDSGTKTLLSSIQNIDKSLSDLSQNILNVNKNMSNMGGNTSGAVKQVENITDVSKKATSALEDVAKAQAKVNGQKTNISSGSNPAIEQQNKLQEELKETQRQAEQTANSVNSVSNSNSPIRDYWKKYGTSDRDSYITNKSNVTYDTIVRQLTEEENASKGIMRQISKFIDPSNMMQGIDTDYFKAVDQELQKIGYHLDEIQINEKDHIASAKILPIDDKAITNAEEMERILKDIQSSATSQNPMKDAFPDKDVSASIESATSSIKEENNALEQNTQKVKENTQAKEQNANVNLSKYTNRLDTYKGKSSKYSDTLKRFQDSGWASDEYIKNVNAVSEALKLYQNTLTNIGDKQLVTPEDISLLDKYESELKQAISTVSNMTAAQKGYDQLAGEKELNKISQILRKNSNMSEKAKAEIRDYYHQIESGNPSASLDVIHGKILEIVNAEERAGRAGKSLWDTFKTSRLHQIVAQVAGMFSFYDAINAGKYGFNVVKDLDTQFTEMRKVSEESIQSLKNYQSETFDTADAVGTTAKQIQASTADYMRLGESLDEAAESAKTANILFNVSEFDNIEDATKSLVAMGQAYKDLDKLTIVDKLNEVGNNYSISTDELASALQRSAATLSLMGNTIDEAAAMVTTANATIQDADSVSAGLRTISLRLVGTEEAEEELSAMDEEVDAFVKATNSKKQQIIKDYTAVASNDYKGFDILDSNGNYKNTYEILLGIAKIYKEIQEQDKKLGTNHATAIIEELAGKNRSSIASAILQDPTQLEAVKKSSEEASGSATKELDKYLDSIEGKIANLQNRVQEFWATAINSDSLKVGIDFLTNIVELGTNFVDIIGTLPTILGTISSLGISKLGEGSLD